MSSPFDVSFDTIANTIPKQSATPPSLHKRRRASKAAIKRSASTPQMRSGQFTEVGPPSPNAIDKQRRNKLGYQRTTVACGRCSNCIRLKKECHFYPVEQQLPHENQGQSSCKTSVKSGASSALSSSPPMLPLDPAIDHMERFGPYPQMIPNDVHRYPMSVETNSALGISGIPHESSYHSNYEYQQAMGRRPSWNPSALARPALVSEEQQFEEPSSSYWRLHEPPAPTEYTPYSRAPTVPSQHTMSAGQHYAYDSSREDRGWAVPTRSMSYGNIEGLPNSYSPYHLSAQRDHQRPSPALGCPPSIGTSSTSPNVPLGAGPTSGGTGSQALPHFEFGPSWSPYTLRSRVSAAPLSGYEASWYGEPAALGQVDEEPHTPFASGPPI
ncbi:hypothetical protein B0A49_10357 [Cryomyces minteri]|uniref:Zn(2)-C6 fungal-type domain-containing protein n=1 Tax=Cryomyces minteri TaxID=331657 RepID=A0A4U0WRC5_9PEZI|nr:hypothetical protein B0A49_11083 [Cryomyces minteri]TKA65994.1 hypothetical protein B0A49_10357 [Cryomyces minteri]